MKKYRWLLFILLLLLPAAAFGETLFVSPGNGTLTEALAVCGDGDVIELGNGVYSEEAESFPLTVSRKIVLRAAEGANPVIDAPAMKAAIRVEADGAVLEGLEIRFRRTGIYNIANDLTLLKCSLVLADENLRVSSCGMWCGGIYRLTMRDCAFTGCSVAFAGPPLSGRSASLPKLTGLFEVGEDAGFFTTHTIENCTVNEKPLFYAADQREVVPPDGAGEIICCGCDEVVIRNADVSDASIGIVLAYNRHVTVEDSRADRCGVFGIYVAKCDSGDITRCSAEGTNHGIDIRADRNITLRDCTALHCEQGLFFSAVQDSHMIDCTVRDTRQGYFMAAGSGNGMTGCTSSGCENGIHLETEGETQITACTVEKCTVCGIRADRTHLVMTQCTLRNNWVAAMVYCGKETTIRENVFEANENCSLYLRDAGAACIAGNRFSGSGEYSVLLIGTEQDSFQPDNETDKPPTQKQ